MNNERNSSNGRQIIILIGVLVLACFCLVILVAAAYFLYFRDTGDNSNATNDNSATEVVVAETTPDSETSATPSDTDAVPTTPAATPVPTLAPATLPPVTVPVTTAPTDTPTPTATPQEEPTLFVTDTPTPTSTPGTGGGVPAPRLANHTNCQSNISQFGGDSTIEFRWTWSQRVDSARGYYLEVRIGPRGATNLSSQGGLGNEVLFDASQNLWQVRIHVPSFYQSTANDYEWQVAYMNNNQRVVVASSRGCFNIR